MKSHQAPISRQALYAVAGVAAAVAALVAFDMARLGQAEQLWGHRPLVFFLAGWAAVVLGRAALRYPTVQWRHLGLSTLSGVLLGLGFPAYLPVPLLMFVGFVPLLWVQHELSSTPGRQGGAVFRQAYHAFVVWNILSTYWVTNTAVVAGVVALLANAALMCIPFMLYHHTRRVLPRLGAAAFAAYWMTFEHIHLGWEMTWPWLTLGNAFAKVPSWVQWYEYTGVFGGSLWILVCNITAFQWLLGRRRRVMAWRMGLLLVLPIAVSLVRYYTYQEQGWPVEVAVVQPNYEPHYRKFTVPAQEQVARHLALAREAVTPDTRYLVFPETTFPSYTETSQLELDPAIVQLRAFMAEHPRLKVVTGLNAYRTLRPGDPHGPSTRSRHVGGGQYHHYEVMNAAVQLSPETEEVELYMKSKLVPGPEIFPFRRLLFFVKPLIERLDGTVEGLATQPQRTGFASQDGRVAPVICYESVFGDFSTGYIRPGEGAANAIFVMTNDGWWDDTPGHRQHLWFASLRAIETRRPVARSANTGISGFLNQRGDIGQTLAYNDTGTLRAAMRFNDHITFYVVWGDFIARIALFVSLLLLANTVAKGWLAKVQKDTAA